MATLIEPTIEILIKGQDLSQDLWHEEEEYRGKKLKK